MTKEEEKAIGGSGLFFFNTDLINEKKLEILKWYRGLHQFERDYVDTLRNEERDSAEYFSDGNVG